MTPKQFVQMVASIKLPDTFNPYADRCEVYDKASAPKRRRAALLSLIEKASKEGVHSLWIGRDLGYRGGRRTGMALTDEIHIENYAKRWGISLELVTVGTPVAERTADIIWRVLDQIPDNVFLWNVFPFHPHEKGNPFSNRAHTAAERRIGEEILASLVEITRPSHLIAIGNDAAASLKRQNRINMVQFRHPSYGGQNQFIEQARRCYGLPMEVRLQHQLF